jgi:hypothetical protein
MAGPVLVPAGDRGLRGLGSWVIGGHVRGRHLLLAAQRATEPPVHPGDPVPGVRRRAREHLLPARGLVTLAPVYVLPMRESQGGVT